MSAAYPARLIWQNLTVILIINVILIFNSWINIIIAASLVEGVEVELNETFLRLVV